jgi:microcystin-dependent protein
MAYTTYNCDGLQGGTERKLDALAVADLSDKDRSFVAVGAKFYYFKYNATGTAAENVTTHPYVVRPDDYSSGGNWEEQATVSEVNVLTGAIFAWPTETVPSGYLECNGASLDTTTYAALYAVLGTLYGQADGTHFNLPDYRGCFMRGWDHAAANDPDRATRTAPTATGATIVAGDHVGTKQADAFKSHNHTTNAGTSTGGGGTVAGGSVIGLSAPSIGSTGGNETRPLNINVMYIIKT